MRQEPWLLTALDAEPASITPTPAGASDAAPHEADPVGRASERARLHALLDRPAGAALLVGEPGIGKSWLAHDLADVARRRGYVVASGACSQDDGAPPLWPWLGVLRALDPEGEADLAALVERSVDDESAARQAFETSDRIATALFRAADTAPVLVASRRPALGRRRDAAHPAPRAR